MSIEFYDEAYKEYPLFEDTPMHHMYVMAARLIPRLAPVIDLGCGSGYLASALSQTGYIGKYVGYDFSPVAVDMARAAFETPQLRLFEVDDQYDFQVEDLYDLTHPVTRTTHSTVFTCFEVLEHVPDDCAIVAALPARSRFLFSVPNYWSESHVRTFDSMGAGVHRYSEWLTFNSITVLPTKQPGAAIYFHDTIRRSDKW